MKTCKSLLTMVLVTLACVPARAVEYTWRFNEMASQPIHDVWARGVSFEYYRDGVISLDAVSGIPGIGTMRYLQEPVLEGRADGRLILNFTEPVESLSFGIARSTIAPIPAGAHVRITNSGGELVHEGDVPVVSEVLFSEGRFEFSGSQFSRVVLTFPVSETAGFFALDNLAYRLAQSYQMSDVILALQISVGQAEATPERLARLNLVVNDETGYIDSSPPEVIDIRDAARIARALAGLDSNL